MDFVSVFVFGLVQGITEFLPLSASGHMALLQVLDPMDDIEIRVIMTVFYLAASAALMVYFRSEIWVLFQSLLRKLGRLPTNEKDLICTYALLLGSVPAIILGLLVQNYLDNFTSLNLLAITVFGSAIFYMYTEWRYYLFGARASLTVKKGVLIGLLQILAFVPGFSRTGTTLSVGMLLGLNRLESAKFSFLLAIPITLTVGIKKLFELFSYNVNIQWWLLLAMASVSFFIVLITVHYFLRLIQRHTLWPFIWYNLVLTFVIGYFALLS